ncbi:hypothetical protein IT570_03585 [Candidatus Sumerlaeota bacterium]|nr:hypothetical protein [Candidatus Sumerlaeota bacterium]
MIANSHSTQISGKEITFEEPSIGAVEQIARDFEGDLRQPNIYAHFMRDMAAIAIVQIDGKPVDHGTFDARETFPRIREWQKLQSAYNKLMGADELAVSLQEALKELRSNDYSECTLKLPSGKAVLLRPLTIKQDEEIEKKGHYQLKDGLRALHDKINAAIVQVDGAAVDHSTFNARVAFPFYKDWQLLTSVYPFFDQDEESIENFLRGVLGLTSTTAK